MNGGFGGGRIREPNHCARGPMNQLAKGFALHIPGCGKGRPARVGHGQNGRAPTTNPHFWTHNANSVYILNFSHNLNFLNKTSRMRAAQPAVRGWSGASLYARSRGAGLAGYPKTGTANVRTPTFVSRNPHGY